MFGKKLWLFEGLLLGVSQNPCPLVILLVHETKHTLFGPGTSYRTVQACSCLLMAIKTRQKKATCSPTSRPTSSYFDLHIGLSVVLHVGDMWLYWNTLVLEC